MLISCNNYLLDKLIKWKAYMEENPEKYCYIDNVCSIIMDEVHERSTYCDLVLGTLKSMT